MLGTLEMQEKAEVVVEKIVRNKRKCVTIIKGLDMFGELLSLLCVHLSQICRYVFVSINKHMDWPNIATSGKIINNVETQNMQQLDCWQSSLLYCICTQGSSHLACQ